MDFITSVISSENLSQANIWAHLPFVKTSIEEGSYQFFGMRKTIHFDGLVKSLPGRHSRAGWSPEHLEFRGFPSSRE